jgi:hypothetical protein
MVFTMLVPMSIAFSGGTADAAAQINEDFALDSIVITAQIDKKQYGNTKAQCR